jgi:hypothetical protein
VFPFSKLPAQSSCTTPIDASVLLITSPSSLTGHAAIPVSNSTNLRADAPSEVTDDVMLVANGDNNREVTTFLSLNMEMKLEQHQSVTEPPQK